MSRATVDVAIIGGGPAGITAALELSDANVLLLESGDRLGGRTLAVERGAYPLNVGAHLFPGQGSHMQRVLDRLGLETIEIPGSKIAMVFDGRFFSPPRVESYPFVLPLSIRERIGMARVGLTLLNAVRGRQRAARRRDGETEAQQRERTASFMDDRSFRQLIGRPPGKVDLLFSTTARRASVDIDQQTAGVATGLFASVWAGRTALALNLKGGSGRLGEAAQAHLGDRVQLGSRVVRVAPEGDGALVEYERDGARLTVRARHVISAAPAPIAATYLEGLPADVLATMADVRYGPFLSMGILTDEDQPMPYDRVYAMTTPGLAFDMLFNLANALRGPGPRQRGGSFMAYLGGTAARKLTPLSDEEITRRYLDDLTRVFPALRGAIKETWLQRWEHGNIARQPGFDFSPVIRYCERDDTVIHLCGDWFGELGFMEYAAGSAIEAAAKVRAGLAATPTQ